MWGELDESEREARKAVLGIISEGMAPDVDLLAVAVQCPRAEAARLLDALVAKGYVVRDEAQGSITAAYPLSVRTHSAPGNRRGRPIRARALRDGCLGDFTALRRGHRYRDSLPTLRADDPARGARRRHPAETTL